MDEKDIKERILRGAMELFLKYGVRSVSMDDIARQLSVSKKTLYQYFADKDEIVTTVSTYHLHQQQAQYEGIRASAENAIDELVKISSCIRRDLQSMNPSLLFDLQKFHPRAWSAWLAHKQQYMGQSIIRNLKQGIAEGFFRAEINTEILATARFELVQITFDEQVFPKDKYSLAEVNLQLFEHFVYGVLTDKGRKVYEKYKQQLTANLELSSPIL
jgi:TetR/AcrR family transcriptional regulator, cholesterol catabolism regulator